MKEALHTGEVDLASRRAELDRSLHESLANSQEAIAMYEARIDDAIAREDRAEANAIVAEAIEDLDAGWEFHHRPLLIVGSWYRGQVVSTGESGEFQLSIVKEDVAEQRLSLGFTGMNIEGKMRIGLCFFAGQGAISTPLTRMNAINNALVLPEDAAISMGSSFVDEDRPTLMQQVASGAFMQDKLLKLLKQHTPDHAKPRDNREAISQIVAKANNLIGADDVPYIIDTQTRRVFRHNIGGSEERLECLEAATDTSISINGRLLGATALELIESVSAGAGAGLPDEDTRNVGLVFAIEPIEHNIPGDSGHTVLYVPFETESLHLYLPQPE